MLEDRDYMRQPEYTGMRWSLTTILLIVYVGVYLLELVQARTPDAVLPPGSIAAVYFALSLQGLSHGYVWQLFTYQFMHGGIMHLAGNCMTFYFFGRALEDAIGWKRSLTVLLFSGVIGGLFQMGVALLWPQYFGGAVIGASAGVFGVIAAYAMLEPDQEVSFFFIPVGVRLKTVLIIFTVFALMGIAFSQYIGGNIAHASHLGGILAGIFYVRQVMQGSWFRFRSEVSRSQPRLMVAAEMRRKKLRSGTQEVVVEDSDEQFIKNEVDPILDKITAQGIHSLTARERKILENARKKMSGS